MGRISAGAGVAKAISKRLKDFAVRRYKSWEGFYTSIGVGRTTASSWVGTKPKLPDTANLLKIARKTNLSLDWLLLGVGPELWLEASDTSQAALTAPIKAELRQSEDATSEEFDYAWKRLMMRSDFTNWEGEDPIVRLAVEGVRPRFQEELRALRTYRKFADIMNTLPAQLDETG